MYLCFRRFCQCSDSHRFALSVWVLFDPLHPIAADGHSLLRSSVLVVVFHYPGRTRPLFRPGSRAPWAPDLGIPGHASSDGGAAAARGRSSASLCRRRTDAEGPGSFTTFLCQRGDGANGYRCRSDVLPAFTTDLILEPERSPHDDSLHRLQSLYSWNGKDRCLSP